MDDVVLYHPNTYNQDFVAAAGDLFEGDYVGVAVPSLRGRRQRQPAGRSTTSG